MSRPSDAELYRLFDLSPIGMYRTTQSGRFLYVNPALARMLSYTVDELLAKNLNDDIYVDGQDRERLIEEYRPVGVVNGARMRWKDRHGNPKFVAIYGHVVEGEGEPSFDASVLDVTDAEAAREDLQRTAGVLELVVHQLPAIYWLMDHDLRIRQTGGAIEEVLGYPPDRFIGKTLAEAHAVEAGSGDPFDAHRRALSGEVVTYNSVYRGRHLATTIGPWLRGDQIVGVIGTGIDVTASRELERRMVDAQRAESLGVLAGGLAHDFNNLLVAILGNADLGLRDVPKGAPGRDALENVRSASLRAAELTDQLLSYAGRGVFAPMSVAIAPVVDELLRISAATIPEGVEVDIDLHTDLTIRGDAAQIRQVVLNLVANARDALAERGGTIRITGRLTRHDGDVDPYDIITAQPGSYVLFEIADDGPGMTIETRRRVFDPFFTTKRTGHGLGLAAVLGIVRAHMGGLRLVSEPDRGATFQVFWPSAAPPPAPAVLGGSDRKTVLVIDDEDLVRDVVARMIEDLGYAAVTAADGSAGLALLEKRNVHAVLVDLTMPLMSGADVISALRERKPALPIVLCSGFDRDRRGPVKADAYLPKPFRIEALEQTLAKLLR